jgi:hypothetical protein
VSRETRMTHATRFAAVAVLVALALCVPVQAQTPEIDALPPCTPCQPGVG